MDALTQSQAILRRYRALTPASRRLMARAARAMPGGNTRTTSYHPPYPVVFESGKGPWLRDADGRRYVDLFYNGLSLIHGHAYGPLCEAAEGVVRHGTAWSGASRAQIGLAEALRKRLPGQPLARFTNSGSEAGMLAVKVARRATGRDLILKFTHAYHGMYPELEAGLYGQGEIAGTTALAQFGDIESCRAAFERHRGRIAAVIYEPLMFTGRVVTPPDGFLTALEKLAESEGALTILDDCLMLRLAKGGSAERFGLKPDLTILGKFIGGGTPRGVLLGREDVMRCLDPREPGAIFHGGSFNGNVLGCALGVVTLADLTSAAIRRMDRQCDWLRSRLAGFARDLGLDITVSGMGSVGGIAFAADQARHEDNPSALGLGGLFHLACLAEGVALGPGGLFALATAVDNEALETADAALGKALATVGEVR